MDIIIFAHPDNQKSHNALILKYVLTCLKKETTQVEVIDLYADGFDPVLQIKKESDKNIALTEKYQKLVAKADRLIFIFPVWWYNLPAILKGFVEHVFNSGLAYAYSNAPDNKLIIEKKLTGKSAVVINTYGRSKQECVNHGSPLRLVFDKTVLEFCGISVTSRVEWFGVKSPVALNKEIAFEISRALAKST